MNFKLIIIVAILALLACTSCKTQTLLMDNKPASNDWNLVKKSEKEQWSLYSRKYPNSKFLEFRVIGIVNASPNVVFNTAKRQLMEDENLPKEMKQSIIEESKSSFLTYYEVNMPFIFKDRDLALQYNFHEDTSGNSYMIDWIEVPEKAPALKKGVIRIVSARGVWQFSPNNAITLATFTQQSDIGGKMPVGLVNKMSGKSLVADLLKLREMVALQK